MKYNYAVSILQEAAFKVGGEILTDLAMQSSGQASDIEKIANEILFGTFSSKVKKQREERYLELLMAINLLQGQGKGACNCQCSKPGMQHDQGCPQRYTPENGAPIDIS